MHELLLGGEKEQFEKNALIQTFDEGKQKLYLISSGYIKRYSISDEGTKNVQNIYGPGDFFPLTLALNSLLKHPIYQGLETYYYETMRDTEVFIVDISKLLLAVENNPNLYQDILEMVGGRLHESIHRFENQTLNSSYKKIAHNLIFLARRFGIEDTEGTKIDLSLTHQDLAELLILTRETVTREMKKLRDQGLIIADYVIIIPDIEKLKSEVHS